MPKIDSDALPVELRLALAYCATEIRPQLATFFVLDQRLARILVRSSEPALVQIQLAWWRDMLGIPIDERPRGDAVLDAVNEHWAGQEQALIHLVDGWENLTIEPPIPTDAIEAFARGRAAPLIALAQQVCAGSDREAVAIAARNWALADGAAHTTSQLEKSSFVALAEIDTRPRLPRELRGLGVLSALARRSCKRGGRPLMEGRGASLTALRAGLIGR